MLCKWLILDTWKDSVHELHFDQGKRYPFTLFLQTGKSVRKISPCFQNLGQVKDMMKLLNRNPVEFLQVEGDINFPIEPNHNSLPRV